MAVTAAPHGRVPGCVDVEQGKSYRQVSAGMEFNLLCFAQSNLVALLDSLLVERNNVFIAADHVQTRSCGRLNRPWIVTKPFDLSPQRLIHIAKCFHIGLHYGELLRGHLEFRVRSHVYGHANRESSQ